LSGADVTVKGNLVISGTTTTINSTTVSIGDNIIQLNGTGATNAGLVVRDATSPNTASGSFLWDTTNDKWIAGVLGSEDDVVLRTLSQTLTNKTISGASNTLSNIGNGSLTNSSITIAGTSTSLGGSISAATILTSTGVWSGSAQLPSGVVSGSAQIIAGLPSGTVSGSSQIILTSGQVTTGLGYTPYNATNPSGYISSITSGNVTTALGYTPYNATNPNGYITGINSSAVTTALGFTPYNATNPSGYISSITSGNVTTALGFTPYNATNPSGYITGISFANVSSKPTTLSGYGITDSIKSNGTINNNIDSDWGESFTTFDPIPTGTPPISSPNLRTINVGADYNRRTQMAFNYATDQAWFRRRQDSTWGSWREFIHSGNIGSQTVATAGALSSMNISQFTNNSGYITGINSSAVTTALGYTPYNATNPSGYISSITSGNVTTALGYTPYNATNPNGYITSDSTKLPLAGGTMTGTITITNTDIRSNSTSNWTGDPGTQGKIQYHSARWYIVSDSASDRIVQFRRNGTDVSYIDNSGNFIGNASTATSAGSASTAGYASSAGSAPNASNLNSMYGVSTGGGNGLNFGVDLIYIKFIWVVHLNIIMDPLRITL